ncbi:hypothetical protein SAMN05444745_10518 [Arthrobacter sp. OV608]|nr:hypothetical protein SAMN05444745_10518 [Arthrobacter sp. OV608]
MEGDVLRIGAFLGSEDRRCAMGAAEGVVDVACDDEFGVLQFRECSAENGLDLSQRSPLP